MRFPIALVLAVLALPLRAQSPAGRPDTTAAVFVYLQAGDTIAYEAVRQDSGVIRGVIVAPNRPRVNWEHLLVDGAPGPLTISVFPPNAPGEVVPLLETDFLSVGDSIAVTTRTEGKTRAERLPSLKGALPLLGRSMLHTASLAWYAQLAHRDTVPVFVTSSGRTVQAITRVRGDAIVMSVDGLEIISTWRNGTLVDVTVPAQALRVVRMLALPPTG